MEIVGLKAAINTSTTAAFAAATGDRGSGLLAVIPSMEVKMVSLTSFPEGSLSLAVCFEICGKSRDDCQS